MDSVAQQASPVNHTRPILCNTIPIPTDRYQVIESELFRQLRFAARSHAPRNRGKAKKSYCKFMVATGGAVGDYLWLMQREDPSITASDVSQVASDILARYDAKWSER